MGSNKNSFIPKAYGNSRGNLRGGVAQAFGVEGYTDDHGFRIDPQNPDKQHYESAIAITGDSVSFGVGVEEEKTVAGLLRTNFPEVKVFNTSVSGYRVNDYKNIVDEFILKNDSIKSVFLFFCLNDISYTPLVSENEIVVDDVHLKGGSDFFRFLVRVNNLF